MGSSNRGGTASLGLSDARSNLASDRPKVEAGVSIGHVPWNGQSLRRRQIADVTPTAKGIGQVSPLHTYSYLLQVLAAALNVLDLAG